MYDRVLDEVHLAGELVDSLRAVTDAPLPACIEAAKAVLAAMSPFVKDDAFTKVYKALQTYVVDTEESYDGRLLRQVGTRLDDIFREKEELSYSSSQDDEALVEYLRIFADCTAKTDPKIPMAVLSQSDFMWLGRLIALYQMDQNSSVQLSVINCIDVISERCSGVIPYLLESGLPSVLALQFPTLTSDKIRLHCLAILTRIYSIGNPPLEHFDYFTSELFEKLLRSMDHHAQEIFDFLVNFNGVVPASVENPVLLGLTRCPLIIVGEIFVDSLNKNCSYERLQLLLDMCAQDGDLLNELFYSNDLGVLCRVIARELINSDSEQVRNQCLRSIVALAKRGISDETTREAVYSCTNIDNDMRQTAINLLA